MLLVLIYTILYIKQVVIVVIAIIAILAAMLLPALSQARERGRSANCIGNLKQQATALRSYAADNREILPPFDGGGVADIAWRYVKWQDFIYPYMGYGGPVRQQISLNEDHSQPLPQFACPAQADDLMYHYGLNYYLGQAENGSGKCSGHILKVKFASMRMLIMDRDDAMSNSSYRKKTYVHENMAWESGMPVPLLRHPRGSRNAAFLDGHVGNIDYYAMPSNRETSFWGANAAAKGYAF